MHTKEFVETKYFTFAHPPEELTLDCGEKLGPITVAYETYGTLNKNKSNAILILHALSGDAHAAGFHKEDEKPGWWDEMIGPGKAFDTDKYFIICSNVLGGCKGTTGPSSINPTTGKPYGLNFPIITIKDMVDVEKKLIDHLGIDKLLSIAGGSMGGMQVLQWLATYPDKVKSAIPIATTAKHSPQQIAFNEVGRQAIMSDPNWNNGAYHSHPPTKGLAIARMIGHITYMSEASMLEKFGRKLKNEKELFKFTSLEAKKQEEQNTDKITTKIDKNTIAKKSFPPLTGFTAEFEVEGYLRYKGDSFVKRFDANSYLYITKAIDYFDLTQEKPLQKIFKDVKAKLLVIAFTSDWLYSAQQSREIVKACKLCGIDVTHCEIPSSYGHDAFLLESKEESHLIKHFLKKVYND